MRLRNWILIFFVCTVVLFFSACEQADGNDTGSEYMMDMGHSIAYEINTSNYYDLNTWGTREDYHEYVLPRHPQAGTIPRGYSGMGNPSEEEAATRFAESSQGMPVSGFVPYYYEDTEEDRARATAEIIANPFPITAERLANGKELYEVFCGICHGEKGDGLGYLVRDDGGVYPAQPANLINEEFTAASNGRFYHSIMYGLNVMGPYKDKISYEERWNVIHYIRSLQAAESGVEYSETTNTLNATFGAPGASKTPDL